MKKIFLLLLITWFFKPNLQAQDIGLDYGYSKYQNFYPEGTISINLSVYGNGPNPVDKFRLVISVPSEFATISHFSESWSELMPMTDFREVSRPDPSTAIIENASNLSSTLRARVFLKLKKPGSDSVKIKLLWTDTTPPAWDNPLEKPLHSIVLTVKEQPTPVSIASFSVKGTEGMAALNWSTAQERNNAFFEVQHSTDGITFERVGQVTGKGNSTKQEYYHFTHAVLNPSILHYYRLKQVDFDGKFEYSTIRSLQLETYQGIQVMASTSTSRNVKVLIHYSDGQLPNEAKVSLFNQSGKMIDSKQVKLIKGDNNMDFQTSSLISGVYIVRFENQANVKAVKVVLP